MACPIAYFNLGRSSSVKTDWVKNDHSQKVVGMTKKRKKVLLRVGEAFGSVQAETSEGSDKAAERINAESQSHEGKTRTHLSYLILTVMIIFIFGAAIIGITSGSFSALQSVWAVVGPFFGIICSYYYYRKTGGRNEPD